jgi:hypothetical protein
MLVEASVIVGLESHLHSFALFILLFDFISAHSGGDVALVQEREQTATFIFAGAKVDIISLFPKQFRNFLQKVFHN